METKRQQAIDSARKGDWKKAFRIVAAFRIEFNKEEQRTLQIAKEVLGGHDKFYKQLGIDTQAELQRAKELVINKYRI